MLRPLYYLQVLYYMQTVLQQQFWPTFSILMGDYSSLVSILQTPSPLPKHIPLQL